MSFSLEVLKKEAKMYESSKERRQFVRFGRILPIKFKDLDSQQEGRGESRDISAKGIGFTTDIPISEHANIEILVYFANNRVPISLRGKVAWSTKVGSNSYRVGVDLAAVDFLAIARTLKVD